ncbi:uracil-DNA glycosylase [Suid betaherpesvirus 2]|uniref:Uracil-DNA glycosylase n=1 Tax=Suid betaherpesvirus 2 TaxID=1608255 RepID=U3GPM7_9BETA|nr:uracil-DNA glycosylase [Suid betaherpesvirus 2]AGT99271.1 uracil-DNA glycosylase [Suid betaherpesvirus 2]
MALKDWLRSNIKTEHDELTNEQISTLFGISRSWIDFIDLSSIDVHSLRKTYSIVRELRNNNIVFPEHDSIHVWSHLCTPDRVKVVILGQDPYPDERGCGLAFSTRRDQPVPESLRNIYKELARSSFFRIPQSGCLEKWCDEGVLLLNTVFTVTAGKPSSHSNLGWQVLSEKVITSISCNLKNVVFLLWGGHAKKFISLIDDSKHLILTSSHPSPKVTSSKDPFLGNNHFIRTNQYLQSHGKTPVNWNILTD